MKFGILIFHLLEGFMEENITVVFHGFLNLTMKEKLKLVEEMNDYFDYLDKREPIRTENEEEFKKINFEGDGKTCKCCGR